MNYYIDLFSPETAAKFANSPMDVSGFRISKKSYVDKHKISSGDRFICYLTRIQRFIGVFEVLSEPFVDKKPIFTDEDDPFTLRFKVKSVVWLPFEKALPIHIDDLWMKLSFTKGLEKGSNQWTYMVFQSPRLWPEEDCQLIERALIEQQKRLVDYPLTNEDQRKLKTPRIRVSDKKEVIVSIPEADDEEAVQGRAAAKEKRNSIMVQATLAKIGEILDFKIWLPNSDRARVLELWKPKEGVLLDDLPLVFDETTLKTIRNIDVLWIRRRSIVRAFEVEDTTSIYSGILRMADLLALQPMLAIQIHIVAPLERRNDVFMQINRPVFADIAGKALSEICSYISYDSVFQLAKEEKLKHMNDSIIDEYSEFIEE
jgi:predicted RNA-binding protein